MKSPSKKDNKSKKETPLNKKKEINLNDSLRSNESNPEVSEAVREAETLTDLKKEKIKKRRAEDVTFIYAILKYVQFDGSHTYRHDIQTLDFKKVSEDLGGMPETECRKKLRNLMKPVQKDKCLYEVLTDTYNELTKTYNNKPRGFNLFIMANAKYINDTLKARKKRAGNPTIIANGMWNQLTDAEKLAYEGIRAKGKSPSDIYYESLREKGRTASKSEAKAEWLVLSTEEKVDSIKKSAEIKMKFLEDKANIDVTPDSVLGPSEKEIVNYVAYLGMPDRPSPYVHVEYLKSLGEYDENLSYKINKRVGLMKYKALPASEKIFFIANYDKMNRNWEKSMNRWEDNLDEVNRFIVQIYRKIINDKKNKVKLKKIAESKLKMIPIQKMNSVAMPLLKMDFEFSPTNLPPITDIEVYKLEKKEKSRKNITNEEAEKKLSKLNNIKKDILKRQAEKNRKEYVSKLIEYIQTLSEERRRYFLGIHRYNFMKVLKEDVLERDFPNSEYPVFIRQKRTHTKSKVTKKNIDTGSKSARKKDAIKTEITSDNNEKENLTPNSSEKLKRKCAITSASKSAKRRKLNEEFDKTLVKMDPTSDSEEETVNLSNIKKYINSLEFINAEAKIEDIVKVEPDSSFDDYDY